MCLSHFSNAFDTSRPSDPSRPVTRCQRCDWRGAMMNRLAVAVLFLGLALMGAACSDTPTAASSVKTVSSVAVNGTAPGLGAAAQFTATATLSDGTTMDVTT